MSDEVKNVDKLVDAMRDQLKKAMKKEFVRADDGVVASVSGPTAYVRIKGESKATPMGRCCDAKAGDKVLLLRQGTKCTVIGVYR